MLKKKNMSKAAILFTAIISLAIIACSSGKDGDVSDSDNQNKQAESQQQSDFDSVCIGNNVNLRAKSSTASTKLGQINSGDRVKVVESGEKEVLVGKYFGNWLKVETEDGQSGYVLSSFVDTPDDKVEKFHIFFERFWEAYTRNDIATVSKNITFPVKYTISARTKEGTNQVKNLSKEELFKTVGGKIKSKPTLRQVHGVDGIVCNYEDNIEPSMPLEHALTFKVIDGKWQLAEIQMF